MISQQATPLRQVAVPVDEPESRYVPPFPVLDEQSGPRCGHWSPGYGLVVEDPDEHCYCTACGDDVPQYLTGMPRSFGARVVWWTFDVDVEGRCADCVWMDLPAKEPMRHVVEALAALQLSLELTAQNVAEIAELAA